MEIVAGIISRVFKIYEVLLLVRIVMSFFPQIRANPSLRQVVHGIDAVTDIVMVPARAIYYAILQALNVDPYRLVFDFSIIIAFMILSLVERLVFMLLGLFLI